MSDIKRQYDEQGFVGPFRAFSEQEMSEVEAVIRRDLSVDSVLQLRRNRHLNWPLIQDLAYSSKIMAKLHQLMGPQLDIWRSNIFIIPGGKNSGLPWHQDEYHTLLTDPANHISVHMAISPSTPGNHLKLIPGSHKFNPDNMGQHGFTLLSGRTDFQNLGTPRYLRVIGESPEPISIFLKPGEYIIFHPSCLHASKDNLIVKGALRRKYEIFKHRLKQWNAQRSPGADRLAIGLRLTVPENTVLPAAFAETLPRVDKCVRLIEGQLHELKHKLRRSDVNNPIVIVTGAGSGIGRAICKGFAADGYRVVGFGRNEAPLKETQQACPDGTMEYVLGDVCREEDIKQLFAHCLDAHGKVDVLITSAGVNPMGNFTEVSHAQWSTALEVNVIGVALCMREALAHMLKAGHGRIVNMGSRMGSNPVPGWSAYATSKAASAILTQSIALDIDPGKYPDVLVNDLIPGMTKTKMNDHGQEPEEVYPFVRQLVEMPAGSPTGTAFFKGSYTSIWEPQPGAAPQRSPSLLRRIVRKLR